MASPSSEAHTCAQCGRVDTNLLRCSKCHIVYYCNAFCQKAAWKMHKKICGQKERRAEYRTIGGELYFVGIVRTEDGKHFKLNDASNSDLNGPGHIMTDIEYATEMHMYNSMEQKRSPYDHPLLKKVHIRDFDDGEGGTEYLKYVDPEESRFDIKFPFCLEDKGNHLAVQQVRAGDSVKVGACGMLTLPSGESKHFREAFWAFVLSVSSFGFVTAISKSTLKTGALSEGDMFCFPITSVIGMYKGEYWD